MNSHGEHGIKINRITEDFSIGAFNYSNWEKAAEQRLDRYWSGAKAASGRVFTVKMLWSQSALYVRFQAAQGEPLVVSNTPELMKKTLKLWERDVCEIFIAPDRKEPRRYFEFEVAPTGEWLDLAIDVTSGERVTDWDYNSGLEAAARIEDNCVLMAMKIPWAAFGTKPEAGDVWRGNFFRCVGWEPGRGYLAWRPTMTAKPNFHVPERFGKFIFEK